MPRDFFESKTTSERPAMALSGAAGRLSLSSQRKVDASQPSINTFFACPKPKEPGSASSSTVGDAEADKKSALEPAKKSLPLQTIDLTSTLAAKPQQGAAKSGAGSSKPRVVKAVSGNTPAAAPAAGKAKIAPSKIATSHSTNTSSSSKLSEPSISIYRPTPAAKPCPGEDAMRTPSSSSATAAAVGSSIVQPPKPLAAAADPLPSKSGGAAEQPAPQQREASNPISSLSSSASSSASLLPRAHSVAPLLAISSMESVPRFPPAKRPIYPGETRSSLSLPPLGSGSDCPLFRSRGAG